MRVRIVIDVSIMIEGQNGLNWPRWQRIAATVESSGFAGLYRSDHFRSNDDVHRDALELWASLTWLATATTRIAFGPLVSPVSLRNPVVTAMTASAVDDLSGGRLRLGLGAGWQVTEHDTFGFTLLPLKQRFDRFTEALEIVRGLLRGDRAVTIRGEYYQVQDAQIRPLPARAGGPPITIGGKGPRRTLPLVARFADEWNAVSTNLETFRSLNQELDEMLAANGRPSQAVRRTFMTSVIFGRTREDVVRQTGSQSPAELRAAGRVVGTADEIAAQVVDWHAAGASEAVLRWSDLDDTDGLRRLADELLPRLRSG
jgi:F420-dependent oxidoreductase-like protein